MRCDFTPSRTADCRPQTVDHKDKDSMATLPELLQKVVELEGSDLHITTDTPPQIRVHGHLQRVEGAAMTAA